MRPHARRQAGECALAFPRGAGLSAANQSGNAGAVRAGAVNESRAGEARCGIHSPCCKEERAAPYRGQQAQAGEVKTSGQPSTGLPGSAHAHPREGQVKFRKPGLYLGAAAFRMRLDFDAGS